MTPKPMPRGPTQDVIPHQQVWGGAGAMLAGMLIIAFFAQALHGSQSLRLQASATTPAAQTPSPTATPAPLPAAQAWGGAVIQQPLALPGNLQFFPADTLQQNGGVNLIGIAQTGTAPSAQSQVALLPLASTTVRPMYTMPAGANPPLIQSDGRFVLWVGGGGAGAQIVGYFDLQTRLYLILRAAPQPVVNPRAFVVGNGMFAWVSVSDPTTLNLTNLLAGTTTMIPLGQPIAQDVARPVQMFGGDALYVTTDHIVHLSDLATGAATTLPFIPVIPASDTAPGTQITSFGDTLYWTVPAPNAPGATVVESIAHPFQGSSATQSAALLPGAAIANLCVNDRLIAWEANGQYFAWDRQQNHTIALGAMPASGAALGIHGNILWYVTDDNGQPTANIVDTAHLP